VRKFNFSLQWKFFLCIVLVVVPTLGAIFTWAGVQNEKQSLEQVANQARILSRQIILTRQWITDSGGILVKMDSKGARDIGYFIDDRLETSRGWYRQFTPSMVTRKLSQYSNNQDLYRFRLASLDPINPENRANGFEAEALSQFRRDGLTEAFRFFDRDGKQYFHYVVPLYLDKSCLACHQGRGDTADAIRGGLSLFFPADEMAFFIKRNHLELAVFGTGLILVMVFTLFVLTRRFVINPLKKLEKITSEISRGNLAARVDIQAGDEFEKLGNAFNSMALSLSKGRESLEEKISHATRELSEANRELKTLDKLKSDFLANMSHELRSPLTVVRGGIDYLNRTIKIQDNRNYLQIIDKNLNRLIRLVSDLFDFTKIEARKIEWSFEEENLTVLIEEVIEIISPLSLDKNVDIRFDGAGDQFVEMDLERIEQVLVNLIDNAVKYSDPDTEIAITTVENPESVTVSIKDQGVGIPEEDLVRIFDKFSTSPTGSNSQTEGTGLGLAICKAIIEAHSGTIWAESIKGISSTFHFTLPKRQNQPRN
jgi:signal transduction histidine kinase